MLHTQKFGQNFTVTQTNCGTGVAPEVTKASGPTPRKRSRQASNEKDAKQLRRQRMRTPSPNIDKAYAIQPALPENRQPRYAAQYVRPVIADMQYRPMLQQLTSWQHMQSAAQSPLHVVASPSRPALTLLQPSLIDDHSDELLALRQEYKAALLRNSSTCALESDDDRHKDDDDSPTGTSKVRASIAT